MRATSSCRRCRSRAGWRDRQVLSGCRSIDIASATYVNGRSKAASWAGFKGENGQPMIQTVNDPVERMHRLTDMPRSEIGRRGIVRKEIPVYSAAGAIGAGSALAPFLEAVSKLVVRSAAHRATLWAPSDRAC